MVLALCGVCAMGGALVVNPPLARAQTADNIQPPQVLSRQDASYPPEALAAGAQGDVILKVLVTEAGLVGGVEVVGSAGEVLDAAAVEAVKQWQFTPAKRGGVAVASHIRVPFRFVMPAQPAPQTKQIQQTQRAVLAASIKLQAAAEAAQRVLNTPQDPEEDDEAGAIDVSVEGVKTVKARAPSDFVMDEVLTVAPHSGSAAELLGRAPGVYVSRPEGDAVAHEIYLRGFDAAHGQDVEIKVLGVPVNQPSHIHGQGYADLNFVIPEVVRTLRVTEGIYSPTQGDFAVAGSVSFDLGVTERGYLSKTTGGSFGTWRQVLVWAPPGEDEESFGAGQVKSTQGFGENRGALSGGGIGQYVLSLGPQTRVRMHGAVHGVRASMAGVLRREDIEAGSVGFYESYSDVSATSQSASSVRVQVGVEAEHLDKDGARSALSVWVQDNIFRSRTNFTGYLQRSQQNPDWAGKGDLIEQSNQDLGVGGTVEHRTRRITPGWDWVGNVVLGLDWRTHDIDQGQQLLQAPQNEVWDRRVDASIRATDIGLWIDTEWRWAHWLKLAGGLRADTLHFDIDDRLGNFIPAFQRQSHLLGYQRTALGLALGPRATLVVEPLLIGAKPEDKKDHTLEIFTSYGRGYRSPQARQLDEGENAPFATVDSLEGGFRWHWEEGWDVRVTGAAYGTFLSQDVAFDAAEGSLTQVGPTQRVGGVLHGELKPWPWLYASLSATFVHATLVEPPPATPEDPAPAFQEGQLLPYVPPWVLRADIGLDGPLATWGEADILGGRIGIGFQHLSSRPLPHGQASNSVSLLDIGGSLRWRWLEVSVEAFNILNSQYAASEYSFVSDWQTREVPSLLPARHLSAGAPFTILGSVGLHL